MQDARPEGTRIQRFQQPCGVMVADGKEPVPSFFQKTVRDLDIRIVASYGRLLLGRSPASFYVCSPKEDRWVKIPLPNTLPPSSDTAEALEYHFDAATGLMQFRVVVLVRLSNSRLAVKSFSSEETCWDTMECGPVICYDLVGARVSVIAEPPVEEGCIRRVASSVGTTGGQLRMCTFDVDAQEHYGFEVVALDDGVLSVWVRESVAASWVRIARVLVGVARWMWIIVLKNRDILLRRDLVTGETEFVSNLCRRESSFLNGFYKGALALDAFPLLV
ncbi:hypothetical protein C2845_PM15G17790 [Panicum miliaceum]|uniref:Uncharacterized protein n=1 Tax=Panicum miliaceum TaxID=4540 RepID=A0A3L6Q6Q2_PANMI|nr:hypothetical protein C2845_PM15G17790 [Panicum miliaceum]